jgi:hypothetical protein
VEVGRLPGQDSERALQLRLVETQVCVCHVTHYRYTYSRTPLRRSHTRSFSSFHYPLLGSGSERRPFSFLRVANHLRPQGGGERREEES